MTNYRLFPATSGPASPVVYAGNIISGVAFAVAGGGSWFNGYYLWVAASGQSTAPVKCALWSVTSGNGGVVVPGSVVTSGTLSATPTGGEVGGHWNFIPLATPLQLAPSLDPAVSTNSSPYVAAIGINSSFPDTAGFWGQGGPGGNGIASGPLFAFSANTVGATKPSGWALPQGVFTAAGTDPSVNMPNQASGSDNFWVDVQVSDTAPAGYTGTYRIWPNKYDMNPVSSTDSAVNYVIATEFDLTQAAKVSKVWYYSPAGTAQLATWCGIWKITGTNSGTLMAANTTPSWSGAAASGWVSAPLSVTLQPGSYKVAVYNSAATPDAWGPKDAGSAYFDQGAGSNGIVNGPISVPKLSAGQPAYNFADPNNINHYPPTGATVAHAQPTFAQPVAGLTLPAYPYLWAGVLAGNNSSQNYWIDVELSLAQQNGAAALSAAPVLTALARVTELAAAHLSAAPSLAAAARVTEVASAHLSAAAALAPAARDTVLATAHLAAAAHLTASGISSAAVHLKAAATLTCSPLSVRINITSGTVFTGSQAYGPFEPDSYVVVPAIIDGVYDT